MGERVLSVGQLAKRSGVKVSTCHFYEEKGLIYSTRNTGNQRRYHPEILRRISVIKAAQKLGVSLDSIKAAFATLPDGRTPTKRDWQQLSKRWQQELDERINALQRLRDSLDGCIGCGCLSLKSCPLYNPEDSLAKYGSGPVILDQRHK
ncbi:redox-sensitive transcriptional activator SoxR [Alteromonas sp. ASW11-36]|uniref:Redox-sensitive transcriptional activator SoxR n=1 Tax=Alteromonas arenosi TaxID=3055817 RepID=A0ABT7T1E4_9ALTE|nr:redox-sensitive transcriptional activator SoxR [Alteromonas sp. ASW11-36]MDM7862269.1 redox-sensitive transcriptional activator SoxR [Alteromonas sp. ASW11-36]